MDRWAEGELERTSNLSTYPAPSPHCHLQCVLHPDLCGLWFCLKKLSSTEAAAGLPALAAQWAAGGQWLLQASALVRGATPVICLAGLWYTGYLSG